MPSDAGWWRGGLHFRGIAAGGTRKQAAPGQAGLLRWRWRPASRFGAMVWIIHRCIVEESDEFLRTGSDPAGAGRQLSDRRPGVVCWYGLAQARIVEPGEIGKAILLWFCRARLGKLHNEAR